MISLNRNGITPENVSVNGISPAILLMINAFKPTGGVIKPVSTTINVKIPNQMATSSGLRFKSRAITKGKKIGIVSRIIARLSMIHPRNKFQLQ